MPVVAVLGVALVVALGWLALSHIPDLKDQAVKVPQGLFALDAADSAGQSFVARHAGLRTIDLLLATEGTAGEGRATLHLRSSALGEGDDLRTAVANLNVPTEPRWFTFAFAPLAESHGEPLYFYVEAEMPAGASLKVGQAPGAAYNDGSMYVSQRPVDGQLCFALGYAPAALAWDMLAWLGRALGILLVAGLLFVLPGWALQATVLALPARAWKEQLGLAVGLSLSLYPVLLVWIDVAGVRLGGPAVWALLLLAAAVLLWRWLQPRRAAIRERESAFRLALRPNLADVAWVAAVFLAAFARLFVLRSLDSPMWGDSVHHTVLAQLIVDNGGLFESWLPYAPYGSLTVHFGFPSLVAMLMWFTGELLLEATLIVGQVVNFLSLLTLALLGARLVGNRWGGLGVVLIVGFLLPLPNGYVNWGRYAQLSGQAIVPVACWLLWELFAAEGRRRWRVVPLLALAGAGVFLTYYRMPYYVAVFGLVVALLWVGRRWRAKASLWPGPWPALAAGGLLALALVVPRLVHLPGSWLAGSVAKGVEQGSAIAQVLAEYRFFVGADPYLPNGLTVAALGVAIWFAIRGPRAACAIALWTVGIFLLPAARLLRVPGTSSIDGFSVLISLFMPLGLLAGCGVDAVVSWCSRRSGLLTGVLLALLAVAIVLGARDRVGVVDAAYRILAPADLRAMAWLKENTPADSLFLVDGFTVYGGTTVVGSDGGWWLPVFARRANTMPPQYALKEAPLDPFLSERGLVALVTTLREVGVTSPAGIDLLCRSGVTHVYVGQGQGQVALPPPEPMLKLSALEQSPAFRAVYRQDKVGVFALDESVCR